MYTNPLLDIFVPGAKHETGSFFDAQKKLITASPQSWRFPKLTLIPFYLLQAAMSYILCKYR